MYLNVFADWKFTHLHHRPRYEYGPVHFAVGRRDRMVSLSPVTTGITPISFLVAGMGDYVDLERSYLEVVLKLHSTAINGIVADANSASNNDNTKFLYVTNNIGHGTRAGKSRLADVCSPCRFSFGKDGPSLASAPIKLHNPLKLHNSLKI